jgi:TolB protein
MIKIFVELMIFCAALMMPLAGYAEDDSPIVVRLATESQRLPIYLSSFACEESDFADEYCHKLQSVLQFDLDHNGMTYLLPTTKEREKLASASTFNQGLSSADWKALGAYYVVKVRLHGQKLSVRLHSVNNDTVRSIDDLPLTSDLSRDRRQIHQLADTIHKTLFGSDGIATTRILYTLKTKEGSTWNSEVWEADYDGENRRQLTTDSGYSVTPLYIPPKSGYAAGSFFFVSYKTGQPKIYYQSLADKVPNRLTYLKGNQLMPAISRQRDKIAFISDVTGNPDLFIQPFSPETGPTGKPYQIFSTHLATQGTPTFSPDGSRIAFVSNKDGAARIYLMDVPPPGKSLKNIKATLVTKCNKESTAPAWSPDGTKIAFCAVTQGVRQIWIYDFVKREERQLTQGPGNKENPSWAPNSLHLVFNSSDADACELYLINLNQTDAAKISRGAGEKRFPSWEPY